MTRTTGSRLWTPSLATLALLAWALAPASGTALRVRETLSNDLPSRSDYERMERGYYEQILDAGRRLDAPAAVAGALPGHAEPAKIEHGRLTLAVDDVREFVLKPNLKFDPGRGIPWSTNARGMRDKEYPAAKPAGTFRIGLAGDSIATGWGVSDGEAFESRLEAAFDARSRLAGGPTVEILNFAVPGHGPGQRWYHFDAIGWAFAPDLVIYEATAADPGWDERRLRNLLARGIGFDAPVYRGVLASSGIGPGLSEAAYKARLKPLRWELLAGVYRAAAAECGSRGVPSIWVLIPRVGKPIDPDERRRLVDLAHAAGFSAVIDACDAYDGADQARLAVAPTDYHPNSQGHELIARRLDAALSALPELAVLKGKGAGPR